MNTALRLYSGERTRPACSFRRRAEMLFGASAWCEAAIGGAPIAAGEARALPGSTGEPLI